MQAQVRFEAASESDILDMTEAMALAFDDDSRRFRNLPEEGGPPGYNNGEFLHKWMPLGRGYKILKGRQIIGGLIVFLGYPSPENNILGTIFIDPAYQDQGIGSMAMEFVHKTFPAKTWLLETPEWATRNHHFYCKNGYRKVNEHFDAEAGFVLYVFERVIQPI
jgi:GNAT superfamily N-acetyltransferase